MQIIGTPANFLRLDIFSEKVLLNGGNSYVSYVGYNYVGNKQKGNADPYSFYTDFTIDASRPEYWTVFVQDEFKFENLRVRLGLRMDVYDAKRPVLKDMYSLFPIYNVGEAIAEGEIEFSRLNNIDNDFLLYVDKVNSPTMVVGYRKDDVWYNADGIEIVDLATLDVGYGLSPYLAYPEINQVGATTCHTGFQFVR